MSCQNIFVFTFLQCHGKVAFFETKMRVFIESKVKSCKTEGWRPSVHSSIILKSIFVNFSEFGDILPSNFKQQGRTQIWPKFDSDKSFDGFIPISFI